MLKSESRLSVLAAAATETKGISVFENAAASRMQKIASAAVPDHATRPTKEHKYLRFPIVRC